MAIDRLAILAIDIIVNARRARMQLRAVKAETHTLSSGLGNIAIAAGAFLIFRRMAILAKDAVKDVTLAAAEFESQIVDVEKIAGTGNIKELTNDFIALSETLTGTSFKDLSEVMQEAARAGKRGDALAGLTEAASKLAAVDDISQKAATRGLARLSANMNIADKDISRLASTVDVLSDNFTVTSEEILKFTQRLAGFGNEAGLSAGELSALGAALLDTGQSATVSRTSITRLIAALLSEPTKVAESLKMTREEALKFITDVRSGNAVSAINQFLSSMDRLSAPDQAKALQDLGLNSSRVSSTLLTLKGNINKVEKAMKLQNEEWRTGANLQEKWIKVAQTSKSRLTEIEKAWTRLKISFSRNDAVINALEGALEVFNKFAPGGSGGGLKISEDIDLTSIKDINFELKKLKTIRDNILVRDARNFQLGASQLGMIKQTNRLMAFLVKQRERIVELQKEEAELAEEAAKSAKEEADAKAKRDAAALKELTAGKREKFKTIIRDLGATDFQAQVFALKDQLAELEKEFRFFSEEDLARLRDAFNKAIADLRFEEFTRIKEKREKAEKDLISKLTSITGEFGKPFSIVEKFSALLESDLVKADDALSKLVSSLLAAELGALGKPKNAVEFIGLTEAWKKAQTEVKPSPIDMERLKLARKMVTLLSVSAGTSESVVSALDRIEKAIKSGDRIR